MENFLFVLIRRKSFDESLIFSLTLKLVFSQIGAHLLSKEIEKSLEKEIKSTGITKKEISRRNLFLKINQYYQKLKYTLNLVLLGILLPINVVNIANQILQLLNYLFSKIIKRPRQNPIGSNSPLPEIVKIVLEKAKDTTIKVPEKVPMEFDPIRFQRECHLIKEYILTQKELLMEMNKDKAIRETVGDRVTRYCTSQITEVIKKIILKIQTKPVSEGIKMVIKQGEKVSDKLDLLEIALNNGQPRNPNDLRKFINLSKDLAFTMKCLDSYAAILKNGVTPEKLDYLKEKILPDLFVILVAMRKEANK